MALINQHLHRSEERLEEAMRGEEQKRGYG